MKPSEVITEVDALKPNSFTDTNKKRWINYLEHRVVKEAFDTHEVSFDALALEYLGAFDFADLPAPMKAGCVCVITDA